MIRNWWQALGVVLCVGMLVYLLGWGLLAWQTASTRFLEPAPPTAVTAPAGAAGTALDTILDNVGAVATGAVQNRLETQRRRAADGLMRNFMILAALMTVSAAAWTLMAWRQAPRVGVTGAQRLSNGSWVAGLALVTIALVVLSWLTFGRQGPAAAVAATATAGMVGVSLIFVWLGYWAATALGAPSKLRASVPFATRILPLDWSR